MPLDAEPAVLGGAGDLDFLHALENREQLLRQRIAVQAGTVEGQEQFVRGLEGREAAGLGLPLDDVAAGRRVREHDPGQPLQVGTQAQHRPDEPPGGVEEKNDEPA